jgi:hypothetical protein
MGRMERSGTEDLGLVASRPDLLYWPGRRLRFPGVVVVTKQAQGSGSWYYS